MEASKILLICAISVLAIIFVIIAILELQKMQQRADKAFNDEQRLGCRVARMRNYCPKECMKCSWNLRQHNGQRYMRVSGEKIDEEAKKNFRIMR